MNHNMDRPKRRTTRNTTMVIDINRVGISKDSSDTSKLFSDHKENAPNNTDRNQNLLQSMSKLDCSPGLNETPAHRFYSYTIPTQNGAIAKTNQQGIDNKLSMASTSSFHEKSSSVKDRISNYESLSNRSSVRRSIHEHMASVDRSFNFKDLISAFHAIEQKAPLDSVSYILKKFKTNDEESGCAKSDLETECFPKIANNPFFKKDNDLALQGVEGSTKRSSLRNTRRHRKMALDGESSCEE